jgi:hypothetical protein
MTEEEVQHYEWSHGCQGYSPWCWLENEDRRVLRRGEGQLCVLYFDGYCKKAAWREKPEDKVSTRCLALLPGLTITSLKVVKEEALPASPIRHWASRATAHQLCALEALGLDATRLLKGIWKSIWWQLLGWLCSLAQKGGLGARAQQSRVEKIRV